MMNQQGALGRPPMLRGALTPPVRYADGGAVEIPPELAAMSYEQILALLQAQQGALGFADGGDAGDGEGDGGEGEGEGEGGGGEAAGGGAGGGGMGGGYGDDGTGSSAGPSGGSAGPSGTGSAEGSQAGGGFGNDGVSSNSSVPGEQDIADFNAAQAVAGLNADLTAPTFDDITAPVTSTVPALSIAEKEPNFVDRTLADLKNNLSNRADILGGIISDIAKGNLSGLAAKADRAMQDKQAEPAMMGFMSLTPLGSLPAALNAISGPISKGLDAVFGGVAKGLGVDFAHGPISMNDMGDGREPVAAVTDTAPVTVDAGPAAGPAPGQTWLDRWMGPQQAANGGALGYANGGKVPAGAHVIPADVVAAKGNGSSRAGALAYKPLGGKLVNGSGDGRSDSVPAQGPRGALRLSRDEVVIPPQGVKKAGGHGALARDAMQTRQQFRQHLGALPPPRGSREHGKRNGGAFADGGEVEPRRGTPGQMRALYADPTREAGAYEPQGPTWGDLRDMWLASQAEDAEAERVADEAFRAKRLEAGDWSYAPETMGPFAQKVIEGLGMNALTVGKVGALRPTAFDRAQRAAEKNATDMLGLPAGNTAAQRADAQGWVDAYHGAGRLDRLLEKPGLDPKRATSGPMPYLTDDAVMASNYAKNKADTSRLADQDGNYSDWFKVTVGGGKPKRLDDAWYYLPPDEKRALADRLSRVTESEDGAGRLVMGEGPGGRGHWEHTLRENRGNALAAAREIWLDSANLFGREDEFLNVLNAAGFKAPVKYDSPHLALPGVLPAKVRMTNPLNTANDDALKSARTALADAAKGKRTKDRRGGVDLWDKNSIGIREFLERLDDDIANGTTHAWTSIPDDVTAVLKRLGYDGIVDTGGKMGGAAHKVMIPFAPNQVRSRFAAFDPARLDSSDLLAGILPAIGAGALGLQMMTPEEQAGALPPPRR